MFSDHFRHFHGRSEAREAENIDANTFARGIRVWEACTQMKSNFNEVKVGDETAVAVAVAVAGRVQRHLLQMCSCWHCHIVAAL